VGEGRRVVAVGATADAAAPRGLQGNCEAPRISKTSGAAGWALGNVSSPLFENHVMRVSGDLMEMARELCVLAAVWETIGRPGKAAMLVERAAALLAARARCFMMERPRWSADCEGLQ
jgi:hypothetical protein